MFIALCFLIFPLRQERNVNCTIKAHSAPLERAPVSV
jgi:hypothetical protein